jgi:hypothetical protein
MEVDPEKAERMKRRSPGTESPRLQDARGDGEGCGEHIAYGFEEKARARFRHDAGLDAQGVEQGFRA